MELIENSREHLAAPCWIKVDQQADWDGARGIDLWLVVCNIPYFSTFCPNGDARTAITQSPTLFTYLRCWKRYLRELLVWEEALADGDVTYDELPRYITDVINWLPSIVLHIVDPDGDVQTALIHLLGRIVSHLPKPAVPSSRLEAMVQSMRTICGVSEELLPPPLNLKLSETIARRLVSDPPMDASIDIDAPSTPVDLKRVTEVSAYIACQHTIRKHVPEGRSHKIYQVEERLASLNVNISTMGYMQFSIVDKAVSLLDLNEELGSPTFNHKIGAIHARLSHRGQYKVSLKGSESRHPDFNFDSNYDEIGLVLFPVMQTGNMKVGRIYYVMKDGIDEESKSDLAYLCKEQLPNTLRKYTFKIKFAEQADQTRIIYFRFLQEENAPY